MKLEAEGQSVYTENLMYTCYEGRTYYDSIYDAEGIGEIRAELEKMPGVEDTVSVLEGYERLKDGGSGE